MKEEKVWREYTALPPELQKQVADLLPFCERAMHRYALAKLLNVPSWQTSLLLVCGTTVRI